MKRYISSDSSKRLQNYTFNFGDGNSARSRGTECENDVRIAAKLSSDVIALLAGTYMTAIYIYHGMDTFTDEDVFNVLSEDYGWDTEDWNKAIRENKVEEWKNAISSSDISGGDVLMYKITRGRTVIYYDEDTEEVVKSSCYYED